MIYIIDTLEGEAAVLINTETGEKVARNQALMPARSKAGDLLEEESDSFSIIRDSRAEQIAQENLSE